VVPTKVINAYRRAHPDVTINILASNDQITYPKMLAAAHDAGQPRIDCGFFNAAFITCGYVDDVWEPMDPARLPHLTNILPHQPQPENRGRATR
jgi:putative spermidine/putrescine transport system substrate-binding protein